MKAPSIKKYLPKAQEIIPFVFIDLKFHRYLGQRTPGQIYYQS